MTRAKKKSLNDDSSDHIVDPTCTKKQKVKNGDDDKDGTNMNEIAMNAWEHYRNYLDSMAGGSGEAGGDEEDVGDIDELLELLELLKPHVTPTPTSPSTTTNNGNGCDNDNKNDDVSHMVHHYRSIPTFLPVLCSIAHYHLADVAISETVDVKDDDDDTNDDHHKVKLQQEQIEKENEALYHLHSSIQYFDKNAATWSMGSNYGRMKNRVSPSVICQWYERAADCASTVRKVALQLLDGPNSIGKGDNESEEDKEQNNMVKEWIELLFLDGIAGTEYVGGEEEEEEDEEEEEEETEMNTKETHNEDKEDEDKDDGYFTASRIEGISRFMASMLLSIAGKHDEAMEQLKKFRLTHRLHPNVWTGTTTSTTKNGGENSSGNMKEGDKNLNALVEPVIFPFNALPQNLYQQLCTVFSPDAKYWNESNYAHRGYYSYFIDIPKQEPQKEKPLNLIETVIFEHLLPRAKQILSSEDADSIVGAEWWVHTRPIAANLGHNMHFDTDEALLAQEGLITHPILSSVLYLTGGDHQDNNSADTPTKSSSTSPAGATIVLDQTPDSEKVANFCWRCVPRDNAFMLFPGNLLHGVLPCPGNTTTRVDDDKHNCVDPSNAFQWDANSTCTKSSPEPKKPQHRLTFMVGFWTRNVPDKMKDRKLYGPCGPMPPVTEEHTWMTEIQTTSSSANTTTTAAAATGATTRNKEKPLSLPRISPAWEEIPSPASELKSDDEVDDPLLDLPDVAQRIDHRFFVNGAPQCFRESLFQDDDCHDQMIMTGEDDDGGCCGESTGGGGCCG